MVIASHFYDGRLGLPNNTQTHWCALSPFVGQRVVTRSESSAASSAHAWAADLFLFFV